MGGDPTIIYSLIATYSLINAVGSGGVRSGGES
jgi:hypothetical protein